MIIKEVPETGGWPESEMLVENYVVMEDLRTHIEARISRLHRRIPVGKLTNDDNLRQKSTGDNNTVDLGVDLHTCSNCRDA